MVDATELGLVYELVSLSKFKILEFNKFNGTICPSTRIKMYCGKMVGYEISEKLLIYCLQDSLNGVIAWWYVGLDKAKI